MRATCIATMCQHECNELLADFLCTLTHGSTHGNVQKPVARIDSRISTLGGWPMAGDVSDWNVILVRSAFKMWSMVDYPFQKMFTNVYTATPSASAPSKLPRQQRADKHLKEQII